MTTSCNCIHEGHGRCGLPLDSRSGNLCTACYNTFHKTKTTSNLRREVPITQDGQMFEITQIDPRLPGVAGAVWANVAIYDPHSSDQIHSTMVNDTDLLAIAHGILDYLITRDAS